jgi:hypothetical protein
MLRARDCRACSDTAPTGCGVPQSRTDRLPDEPPNFRVQSFLALPGLKEVEVWVRHLRHDPVVQELAGVEEPAESVGLFLAQGHGAILPALAPNPVDPGTHESICWSLV